MSGQLAYRFKSGAADGSGALVDLLGGKGAGLAEMCRLGLPVPPGFTLSTAASAAFRQAGAELTPELIGEIERGMAWLEVETGLAYGSAQLPLLVSVRSGAAVSMPGMMDTVLNVGIQDRSVEGLARRTQNPRFAWDTYRRLVQMYGEVVLGMRGPVLEQLVERAKDGAGAHSETELTAEVLEGLVGILKERLHTATGNAFPQDPSEQLLHTIRAVFLSWNNRRAVEYRNAHGVSHDLGTAVTIQAMVFGNTGPRGATGVAFTRDPNTGEPRFFGEWLPNAQGDDVVSGLRTPLPLNHASGALDGDHTLAEAVPEAYAELERVYRELERHFKDMQDIEFTVEDGRLWLLQTRPGKRSAVAEVRIAADLAREGLVSQAEAVARVSTQALERLLHPRIDPNARPTVIARGLGASPGAATGRVVFHAHEAVEWNGRGERVILVRLETSPEDVHGMARAQGVLTARGGMTSHAAVVARGMAKPCVVGCRDIAVDAARGVFAAGRAVVRRGDVVTLDGASGAVMLGEVASVEPDTAHELHELLDWADANARLAVHVNAERAQECRVGIGFGARGVGLARTEPLFFQPGPLRAMREALLAPDDTHRRRVIAAVGVAHRAHFLEIFREVRGLPVTVRLLDTPLTDFLPDDPEELDAVAAELGRPPAEILALRAWLSEANPMLGRRGSRLGILLPEVYQVQTRAVVGAALDARAEGTPVAPRLMVPLVGHVRELEVLRELVREAIAEAMAEVPGQPPLEVPIGALLELPRACLTAGELARVADFLSFGTNDLTQTVFGLSRDDCGPLLPLYGEMGILAEDPFITLDSAVAELCAMAVERARSVRPQMHFSLCGEHGGDPASIRLCHRLGIDQVSCSPFRVPVARLAAAQAAMEAVS
jgi:pyruvate,orthophosphate dikinase